MDEIIRRICQVDISTIVVMGGMLWVFKNHLDKKFDKIDERFDKVISDSDSKFDKIDKRFDKVDERFDKVDERFKEVEKNIQELRTSINRIEGAFYNKDCCMLKDSKNNEKVDG